MPISGVCDPVRWVHLPLPSLKGWIQTVWDSTKATMEAESVDWLANRALTSSQKSSISS
jgi:hypothetical protein